MDKRRCDRRRKQIYMGDAAERARALANQFVEMAGEMEGSRLEACMITPICLSLPAS